MVAFLFGIPTNFKAVTSSLSGMYECLNIAGPLQTTTMPVKSQWPKVTSLAGPNYSNCLYLLKRLKLGALTSPLIQANKNVTKSFKIQEFRANPPASVNPKNPSFWHCILILGPGKFAIW